MPGVVGAQGEDVQGPTDLSLEGGYIDSEPYGSLASELVKTPIFALL